MTLFMQLLKAELKAHKSFVFIFVLNLALGLTGYVTLNSFKGSFLGSLQESSKSILTADLSVAARRSFDENEVKILQQTAAEHKAEIAPLITLYSMISSGANSRLVEVKGIHSGYPYYGNLVLTNSGTVKGAELANTPKVWVYPEFLAQMKVSIGDSLRLGEQDFEIADTILDDTGMTWTGASFAPRIYVGYDQIQNTGLLQRGSTANRAYLFKLPKGKDENALAEFLNEKLDDPGVRVITHQRAGEQTGRLLQYLSDYLGLVALAALFLSILGIAYFYFSYMSRRLKDIAILMSLGLLWPKIVGLFIGQVLFLTTVACALALMIGNGLLYTIPYILGELLQVDLDVSLHTDTITTTFGIGLVTTLCVVLPILLKVRWVKPAVLFNEFSSLKFTFGLSDLLYLIPVLFVFWGLAVMEAQSFVVGGLFVLCFFVGAIGVGLVYYLLLRLLKVFEVKKMNLSALLAIRGLSRRPLQTLVAFLALSLGALLVNLIPQIEQSLRTEMTFPASSQLPQFFLFDIQEDQVGPLTRLLKKESAELKTLSPLIRARLTTVNGKEFLKASLDKQLTREAQRQQRMKNRGYNLSYRAELDPSEQLVGGRPFAFPNNGLPQISLEMRFANRLGLKIGDVLEFDVQGVPVEGKVVNIRKVQWTTFKPNFFIQFQPGVLEEAPKTFIAAVALKGNETEAMASVQNNIVSQFANISIINVTRLVSKLLDMVSKMSWILTYMAWLSLVVGFVVLLAISYYQSQMNIRDGYLLKLLGAPNTLIRSSIFLQYILLVFFSAVLGSGFAIGMGWAVSFFVFENIWVLHIKTPLTTVLLMTGVGGVLGRLAYRPSDNNTMQ